MKKTLMNALCALLLIENAANELVAHITEAQNAAGVLMSGQDVYETTGVVSIDNGQWTIQFMTSLAAKL